jgi:hypothetical protein
MLRSACAGSSSSARTTCIGTFPPKTSVRKTAARAPAPPASPAPVPPLPPLPVKDEFDGVWRIRAEVPRNRTVVETSSDRRVSSFGFSGWPVAYAPRSTVCKLSGRLLRCRVFVRRRQVVRKTRGSDGGGSNWVSRRFFRYGQQLLRPRFNESSQIQASEIVCLKTTPLHQCCAA